MPRQKMKDHQNSREEEDFTEGVAVRELLAPCRDTAKRKTPWSCDGIYVVAGGGIRWIPRGSAGRVALRLPRSEVI